nr:reverse transcriptase domain-containing protein [Tanacetum cinerariifolium]
MNTASSSGSGSLPKNTVLNPQEDLKAITTRSGVTLGGPSVSPSPPSKEVDREPKTITDQVLTRSTNNVPPLFVQPSPVSTSSTAFSSPKMPKVTKDTVQTSTENIQPPVAQTQVPIDEPVVAPNPKPTIPYPSRANKQKLHEKDDNLALKFVEIFRNLHFELSFANALLHMPKFALMFKSLLNNKEKLFDLATTPVNENCSAVILKKFPKKLRDPGIFLIPCDFPEFDECLALADLDVYGEELTLCVNDEEITFKVGQTSKYSYNDAESINRIDVIDVACEEYVQEVLGFFDKSKSGNPTLILDPIIALFSPSFTPFEGGDFILEEIKACLTSKSILLRIDDTNLDLEGDIRLLEELLNNDSSSSPLPPKELNVEEIKTVKSSIDKPPKLKIKELPSHLEYKFLEWTDKLPIIISNELKDKKIGPFKAMNGFEKSLPKVVCFWTSQFLISVKHGELMTICCVVLKPTLKHPSLLYHALQIHQSAFE